MPNKSKNGCTKYNHEIHNLKYTFLYNEPETTELQETMKGNSAIDMNDIRRIVLWKLNRTVELYDEDIIVEKIRRLAKKSPLTIDDTCAKDAMEELVESIGIGYPVASVILKMIRPDVFPIIDRRAYRALYGKKFYATSCNYEKYKIYAKCLGKHAECLKRPLSEMDEQLYMFDKEKNPKL